MFAWLGNLGIILSVLTWKFHQHSCNPEIVITVCVCVINGTLLCISPLIIHLPRVGRQGAFRHLITCPRSSQVHTFP